MKSHLHYLVTLFLVCIPILVEAQIKIGDQPEKISPYALLELESSNKGFILPRLTTANRDAAFDQNTPIGTLIFNTDHQQIECLIEPKSSIEPLKNPVWVALDDGDIPTQKPMNPRDGQRYYDTEKKLLYFWNNAQWHAIGGPGVVENAMPQDLTISPLSPNNKVVFSLSGTMEKQLDLSALNNSGTDQQTLAVTPLSSTNLVTIAISNGNTQTLDLSTLDNSGTDQQTLRVSPLNASNTFSIEISNGNRQSVDLSALAVAVTPTNTDEQTISVSALSTNHHATIAISNGNTETLDLSALANTPQTLNISSLSSSNTIDFTLSQGNTQTLDLTALYQPSYFHVVANVVQSTIGTTSHDFLFGSDQMDNQVGAADDARFFFDKSKAAFRAGYASGNSWDEANIGEGYFGMGYRIQATGNRSMAMGNTTEAHSYAETVFGSYNTIVSPISTTQWRLEDRLFVIGNGSSAANKSDALVILKNGNIGIGDSTPTEGTLVVSGTLIASQNIIANQTLTPDYVFDYYFKGCSEEQPTYRFWSLKEIDEFIQKNHHLPGVPSAMQVEQNGGIILNRALEIQLEKIEELYLHTLEQEKKIIELEKKYKQLLQQLESR